MCHIFKIRNWELIVTLILYVEVKFCKGKYTIKKVEIAFMDVIRNLGPLMYFMRTNSSCRI